MPYRNARSNYSFINALQTVLESQVVVFAMRASSVGYEVGVSKAPGPVARDGAIARSSLDRTIVRRDRAIQLASRDAGMRVSIKVDTFKHIII